MIEADLGIYVHIPFCKNKCTYCAFASYQGLQDYYERYVTALCKEIKIWSSQEKSSTMLPVDTLYFGGGTPTELSLIQIEKIMESLQSRFSFSTDIQITIESNPDGIDRDYLIGLRSLGINRISFGVQALQNNLLTLLGRTHSAEQAKSVVHSAYEVGFSDISMDFIYGLPEQTLEDMKASLREMIQLPITHLSIYGLEIEPNTVLSNQIKKKVLHLPDEAIEEEMYDLIINQMLENEFERYEISSFAKNNMYSRHNLRYWNYQNYLGFGSGAHGFWKRHRRAKVKGIIPYCKDIERGNIPYEEDDFISDSKAIEEFSFLALRTKWGVSEKRFYEYFGKIFYEYYQKELDRLVQEKLIHKIDDRWILTNLGIKYGNYVFSRFLK